MFTPTNLTNNLLVETYVYCTHGKTKIIYHQRENTQITRTRVTHINIGTSWLLQFTASIVFFHTYKLYLCYNYVEYK